MSFTVRHDVSTAVLLHQLKTIKELTTPGPVKATLGSVVREGLEALAKEMDYPKMKKKYAAFLEHITDEKLINK